MRDTPNGTTRDNAWFFIFLHSHWFRAAYLCWTLASLSFVIAFMKTEYQQRCGHVLSRTQLRNTLNSPIRLLRDNIIGVTHTIRVDQSLAVNDGYCATADWSTRHRLCERMTWNPKYKHQLALCAIIVSLRLEVLKSANQKFECGVVCSTYVCHTNSIISVRLKIKPKTHPHSTPTDTTRTVDTTETKHARTSEKKTYDIQEKKTHTHTQSNDFTFDGHGGKVSHMHSHSHTYFIRERCDTRQSEI